MAKLYDVTISFNPADYDGEVKNVGVRGEFLFYRSNLTGHTDATGMVENDPKYPPALYEDGMDSIGGLYYRELTLNEATGIYSTEMKLPAGMYCYSFIINAEVGEPSTDPRASWSNFLMDDGKMHNFTDPQMAFKSIPDPKNPPSAPTPTGPQRNSELFVGSVSDYPWIPAERGEKGTVTYTSYKDINGADQFLGVYLPPNYNCFEEYPVIYVSHGGGGNEADWFSQGGIANIMDNLIAQRKTEEAILVTMNNSVYQWDFEVIAQNMIQCVMPFVCKTFGGSRDPMLNAFCGLSMGSMTTLYMYMHHSKCWQYYGAFSGGIAEGHANFTLDDPHLMDVELLIGCAEEDIAYNEREIGVPPTIRCLKAKGIPHEEYFTTGSHDWFCWPQMFAYFAENTLWK